LERYLGDLQDGLTQEVVEERIDNNLVVSHRRVVDENDRKLLSDASTSCRAPKGELRFNLDKGEGVVYVKILSIVASSDPYVRGVLPLQMCPLLRLNACCNDSR